MPTCEPDRRRALVWLGAPLIFGVGSVGAESTQSAAKSAAPAQPAGALQAALAELSGKQTIRRGRVHLDLPSLAENGNSVEVKISVDSPMTGADRVSEIHLFSERNPIPTIARYRLGPNSGRAEIETNVRLAQSQRVIAVAKMNDGSLWSDEADIVVLLAACIDGS
jgi:sulfur-oxidizing protein SoxY